MAVKVKKEELTDESTNQETEHISAGTHPAILVSYVEMGKHYKFYKGKKVVFDKTSKKAGQTRPPELHISLCFEFPSCKYTGNRPLTIATSVPMKKGGIMNPLTVSDALASGKLSKSFAMKTNFMKYLLAMQDATGKNYDTLADFVGQGFLVSVTNNESKPDSNGQVRIYANMKPDGIQGLSFRHPVTGAIEEIECPKQIGEYCSVLDWDNPDLDEFKKLPDYMQELIKNAEDYPGSALQELLQGAPDDEDTYDEAQEEEEEPADPADPDNDRPF
jgi:hypothetical protein